jgi:hypothetical protein
VEKGYMKWWCYVNVKPAENSKAQSAWRKARLVLSNKC